MDLRDIGSNEYIGLHYHYNTFYWFRNVYTKKDGFK